MKPLFLLLSISSFLHMTKVTGWEGKSYHFGPQTGQVRTFIGGGAAEQFDEDNPDPLTVLLESENDKAKRTHRKALKQNVEQIFSILVPDHEQPKWYKKGPNANHAVTEVEATWLPRSVDKDQLSIVITANDLDGKKKYQTIADFYHEYEKKLSKPDRYKYSVQVIEKTNNYIVLEIVRYQLGVSDLIKKDTEIRTLEKWVLSDCWIISCSYEYPTEGNDEKIKTWALVKDTWEKRFAYLHFDDTNTSTSEKEVTENVPL